MTQSPLLKAPLAQTPKGRYTLVGGKKSNLLWTCACILPFLNSEQLLLHYFICIHTGATNKFMQPTQKSASGRVCAGISAENVFASQSKAFLHCAKILSSSSEWFPKKRRAVLHFWHILKAVVWHYPSPCNRLVFSLSPRATNLSATVIDSPRTPLNSRREEIPPEDNFQKEHDFHSQIAHWRILSLSTDYRKSLEGLAFWLKCCII